MIPWCELRPPEEVAVKDCNKNNAMAAHILSYIIATGLIAVWTIAYSGNAIRGNVLKQSQYDWKTGPRRRRVNAVLTQPNQSAWSFTEENLTLEDRRPCGASKCLYRLRHDNSLGYLANHEKETFDTMKEGWKMAQIINSYGMEHVFLAPPQLVTDATDSLRGFLGRNITTWRRPEPKDRIVFGREYAPEFPIQMIQIVEESEGTLLAFNTIKYPDAMRHTDELVDTIMHSSKKKQAAFLETFHADLSRLWRLVSDNTCLLNDFQIFLTIQGKIVHFDLDRCFECHREQGTSSCKLLFIDESKHRKNILRSIENWSQHVMERFQGEI